MQKVFMSVLGATDYIRCNYYYKDLKVKDVRFVQEALIGMFCRKWTKNDRIVVFTTEKAHDSNWLDNGHTGTRTDERILSKGLNQCLSQLELECKLKRVFIPDGKNEDEVWEIFRIIEREMPSRAEVIFDITHSLRSLPMLAMVALNFAKTTKAIRIMGIYYGALEALGSIGEVSEMRPHGRNVPILDLTPFDELLDWSVAVDRFNSSGDARNIQTLVGKGVTPKLRETRGKDEESLNVRRLGNALFEFTEIISTCRGRKIKEIGKKLKGSLEKYSPSPQTEPLNTLIGLINNRMSGFKGEDVNDGIEAARWCLKHNLIQQGFTILLETVVTSVLQLVDGEISDITQRQTVIGAARAMQKNYADADKDADLQSAIAKRILHFFKRNKNLINPLCQLFEYRNDFNHAGWNKNAKKPGKFRKGLCKLIDSVEQNLIASITP